MKKAEQRTEAIVRYHERSTHRPGHFAPGPGYLDWANQPDPFRTYEGAAVVELPLAGEDLAATWDELHRPDDIPARPLDRATLGSFLELALGLTAWKEAGPSRWALRANPSSGNLHPTEGYVLVPDAPGVPGGLYHYRSVDHVIERRASPRLASWLPEGGFLVGLASIHWREAWKYGERAFRYCQHDAGHALATVRYAAAVLGWGAQMLHAPGDEDVAAVLGLDREDDYEAVVPADREHPDALVLVAPAPLSV
ncbi:MAG: SagB/ThcOx family dehydrogenase, partial [Vicinamibacteria bacterium]